MAWPWVGTEGDNMEHVRIWAYRVHVNVLSHGPVHSRMVLPALCINAHGLRGCFCMGSSPYVVSWLPKEGQGEEMEKAAVPGEVTVQGYLVTQQSPESACFRFLPC